MKTWFVPPIVIPLAILIAVAIIAVVRSFA
jgi:hypothetical protein